jgi:hypothetical protein
MSREKIARALSRRPEGGDFRQQVFWLVDVIYACKASQDAQLAQKAHLLEDALGSLGAFLETGEADALAQTQAHLDAFSHFLHDVGQAEAV